MNKENIKKWIDALRSGDYMQGSGWLHNVKENEYCCLGVACELAIRDGVDVRVEVCGDFCSYDGSTTALPMSVISWLGVNGSNPLSAIEMNDERGMSFDEIANVIEEDAYIS